MDPNMNNKSNERNHYYNSWFFKSSKLIALFILILNMSILVSLNDKCIFKLMNLIRMTYLTIYQIEHLLKLNKKLTILVKMVNGL
jgi:hypothetical protein